MAELVQLTDPQAVVEAAHEFDALGEEVFLNRYGYARTVDYYLLLDGRLYGSKAIVGVAFGKQHPELGPLTRDEFSGGVGGANRALERLGFTVTTPANLDPPRVGAEFADRRAIYRKYGGDMQGGIARFTGNEHVNVYEDANSAYVDEGSSLTQPFGYRGQGRNGDQAVEFGGNRLLEAARLDRSAVRYWHRPRGGAYRFVTWVAVLGRSWVAGTGDDGAPRKEIRWVLQSVPAADSEAWPTSVQSGFDTTLSDSGDPDEPIEAQAGATYGQLVDRIDQRGQGKPRTKSSPRVDYQRSAAVKRAVLQRSSGRCESLRCTGMPPGLTRAGEPILDVDHVVDLALGGDDHPLNAVALCPNCHAAKTRGPDTAQWRRELQKVASEAHHRQLKMLTAPSRLPESQEAHLAPDHGVY